MRTEPLPVATLGYSLREERDAVGWMHQEVSDGKSIPLLEAYGVVRSLSLAMHGGQAMVMPLLQLKEFDQYTTTHSMNVSVLTMALGEFLGVAPTAVRGFGLAGLLHDLGKVRIPREILTKPGKLTPEERTGGRGASRGRRPDDPRGQRAAGPRRGGGLRAPPLPRRRRLSARSTTRGLPTTPAGWCTSATCTTPSAPAGPTATPGRRPQALDYIEERAGAEFDPAMAAAFIEMMRRWDDRIAIEQWISTVTLSAARTFSTGFGQPRRRCLAALGMTAAVNRRPAELARPAARRFRATMSPTISSPCPRAFSMNSRLASLPLAMTPAR